MLRRDQVDAIIAGAHREVIRGRKVLSATHHTYRRKPGDRPAGMHVYCVPTDAQHAPLEDAPPPRIIERIEDWEPPTPYAPPMQIEEVERATILSGALSQAVAQAVAIQATRQPQGE
jgi:hypothetical protein